jgi:hypothetical protein|nr:MAG TPA: hypothetical protein [Caudoviricetes sp.]
MTYTLPTSVEINGQEYEVRSDFRVILDILEAIGDVELDDQQRAAVVLDIFYPGFEDMPADDYEEAIAKCMWFINCGQIEETSKKPKKLVDWQQDFPVVVAPVNRVMGTEVRLMEYLHWWTFIGAYQEIGDCLFAQIVGIRQKLANGKSLDKSEREFYRNNRNLVDLKHRYTDWENDKIREWV